MTRQYVELAFLNEVRGTVEESLSGAGGNMELDKLEALLNEHYHYRIKGTILTEKQVDDNPRFKETKDKLLVYKSGIVYLN